MKWTKTENGNVTAKSGELLISIQPKGDGRFGWTVHKEGNPNPAASGIAGSLGAAKSTTENFTRRFGTE